MGYVLHLTAEENITISAPTARRLIESGNGDAALLYLCLARGGGGGAPEKLRAELRWDEERLRAAETALTAMGLVRAPSDAEQRPPEQPPERPAAEYSREDVMRKLEEDAAFSALLAEVERKLGRLSEPSVRRLLGLYDELGLPADVVYLLVSHCITRKAERFGPGRLPSMREVEKEGYEWARRELFSTAAASEYLRREQEKRRRYPEYMRVLQLGERASAPAEERYMNAWAEMGFSSETVAIAYDKTMLHCHELKWPYLNGILKRWHEKGLHTPEQVRAENAERPKKDPPAPSGGKNAWMRQYD